MWVFRILIITLPSMVLTAWAFYRWGVRVGTRQENWRWRTDAKLSKMPHSGLFDKQ